MKSQMTSTEVDRIITEAVSSAMRAIPYNGQSEDDKAHAEYFVAKRFVEATKSRVDKFEKKVKEAIRADQPTTFLSDNYQRSAEIGTPRTSFDKDAFIEAVTKELGVPKHKLVELASHCEKMSAAPLSIKIEYIGDMK